MNPYSPSERLATCTTTSDRVDEERGDHAPPDDLGLSEPVGVSARRPRTGPGRPTPPPAIAAWPGDRASAARGPGPAAGISADGSSAWALSGASRRVRRGRSGRDPARDRGGTGRSWTTAMPKARTPRAESGLLRIRHDPPGRASPSQARTTANVSAAIGGGPTRPPRRRPAPCRPESRQGQGRQPMRPTGVRSEGSARRCLLLHASTGPAARSSGGPRARRGHPARARARGPPGCSSNGAWVVRAVARPVLEVLLQAVEDHAGDADLGLLQHRLGPLERAEFLEPDRTTMTAASTIRPSIRQSASPRTAGPSRITRS